MSVSRSTILVWLVGAIVGLLPFQWITLAELGPLSVKPVHVPIFSLGICAPFLTHSSQWRNLLRGKSGYFIVAYLMFWLVTVASIGWSESGDVGFSSVVKEGAHFLFFFVISAAVAGLFRSGRIVDATLVGVMLGSFGYLAYNVLLFRAIGESFLAEYFGALISADLDKLKFWFFQKLFNCSFSGACLSVGYDDGALSASLRNTIQSALVLYVVLVGATYTACMGRAFRSMLLVGAGLSALFVLASLSRSNWVALFIVLLFGALIPLVKVLRRSAVKRITLMWLAWLMVLACGVAVLVAFSGAPIGVFETFGERAGDTADDPRLKMMENALGEIGRAPILGHGTGKEVLDGNGNYFLVHNVFLAAWVEHGLLGLWFALVWYFWLVRSVVVVYKQRPLERERIDVRWVAMLPIIPLVRASVSSGGDWTLVDWVSLSFFFGIVSAWTSGGVRDERFGGGCFATSPVR